MAMLGVSYFKNCSKYADSLLSLFKQGKGNTNLALIDDIEHAKCKSNSF